MSMSSTHESHLPIGIMPSSSNGPIFLQCVRKKLNDIEKIQISLLLGKVRTLFGMLEAFLDEKAFRVLKNIPAFLSNGQILQYQ